MIIDNPEKLKELAQKALRSIGIYKDVLVKAKRPHDPNHLACYIPRSQFTNGKPIFWLSPDIEKKTMDAWGDPAKIPSVLSDCIVHEYGHVIYEYAELRDKGLFTRIKGSFPGDEEAFAEQIVFMVNTQREGLLLSEHSTRAREIIDEYARHFPWKSAMLKEHCEQSGVSGVELECYELEPENLCDLPVVSP